MLEQSLRDTIIELDRQLQLASCSYDTQTIRKLITDDFTLISSSGRVMDAAAFIEDVDDRSVTWYENLTEQADVRSYNDDCAIITAVLHSRFLKDGQHYDARIRFTDTWVHIDGSWRYAAGHASRLT